MSYLENVANATENYRPQSLATVNKVDYDATGIIQLSNRGIYMKAAAIALCETIKSLAIFILLSPFLITGSWTPNLSRIAKAAHDNMTICAHFINAFLRGAVIHPNSAERHGRNNFEGLNAKLYNPIQKNDESPRVEYTTEQQNQIIQAKLLELSFNSEERKVKAEQTISPVAVQASLLSLMMPTNVVKKVSSEEEASKFAVLQARLLGMNYPTAQVD